MSTARPDTRPFWLSRWWMPLFSLFLGGLMLAAFAIGGNVAGGVESFGVLALVGGAVFRSVRAARPCADSAVRAATSAGR